MKKLTPAQGKMFRVITKYRNKTGFSPTQKEIADELNRSSTGVFLMLQTLEKKGYITKNKYKTRGITIS